MAGGHWDLFCAVCAWKFGVRGSRNGYCGEMELDLRLGGEGMVRGRKLRGASCCLVRKWFGVIIESGELICELSGGF